MIAKFTAGLAALCVLKNAGSIDYFCKFHPNIKGRVVVAP